MKGLYISRDYFFPMKQLISSIVDLLLSGEEGQKPIELSDIICGRPSYPKEAPKPQPHF